jgi:putative protease
MKKPEILAPAGNMEKLKAAIAFGADAVYLAGVSFGMRSAAGNFTEEELFEAAKYCHEHGVKMYVTVNTMPHTNEYKRLEGHLKTLERAGADALIISDLGVFMMAKEVVPNMTLHVSTQASVVSARTCTEWYKLGAKRVILARELTLAEITEIKENIPSDLEIEAFVHGSMCVAYSGRCLLSNYMTGRDANRGACAQPCRWEYKVYTAEIEEVKRQGEKFALIEEEGQTYTFSSRDLCMIEHIPELVKSGICSLKIEGRMKSSCYVGAVVNAYRMAIDTYFKNPEGYVYDPQWLSELESVSHRQYDTGFFFAETGDRSKICDEPGYIKEQAALGVCTGYDESTHRAFFTQKNKFSVGEKVELLSPGKPAVSITVDAIYDEKGEKIDSVPHPMMNFSLDIPFNVPEYSILRYARQQ